MQKIINRLKIWANHNDYNKEACKFLLETAKIIEESNQYVVIGGTPFTTYKGTTTYTGLKIIYLGNDKDKAIQVVKDNYDNCGGLMIALDTITGEQI